MSIAEISVNTYLGSVLERLEQQYRVMAIQFGPPAVVAQGSELSYRYLEQSAALLCFLKGVKLVSTLNAALVLLHHGYVHEVAALCRMADDFWNEILFMMQTLDGDKLSKDQERFLADFFQEEFEDVEDPLGSSQKRETVPRRKIFAALAQLGSQHVNPSDGQSAATIIHRTLSGYTHGAYPHIMELYGGNPPRVHMTGMPGTPQEEVWRQQLIGYIRRGIMISERVSSKLGLRETQDHLKTLLFEFEGKLDFVPELDADELLSRIKR
jgi:hypothetical protein